MKKIFRRNQVIITTLAVLVAIAGYITYDKTGNSEENSTVANADGIVSESDTNDSSYDITSVASTEIELEQAETIDNPGETVLTGNFADLMDASAQLKLNREQIRSKNKEMLQGIIDNAQLTDEQKVTAVEEMVAITQKAEKEADAEMLLESKGFSHVVVSMEEDSCDVMLDMGDVTDAKCAQVEDIVKRKTGIAADKIVITPLHTDAEQQTGSVE